jgi:hypothetical protein
MGFENTQLISTEAYQEMEPADRTDFHSVLESIVDDEFEDAVCAMEGIVTLPVSINRDPVWSQWASQ